ncbi:MULTISPECIES: ABC transporter ATP-binding protein [Bosea]|uniref:ABC transporter ATP-binding protein n=1 Tax=Bosea TaxID=85413 RepID=UPI00214F97A9|nr:MULTISPECIES: ABC transporter ATP-binding protein [Bosea]MCR4521555.1 ABC transporter ATP-binding protein [Bosea sp. 47.2.35]MDR6829300.1 peptide/nickel transport system ATP-binding protein [Bosea robiniae]MDR6896185.1 peptide/nickel transport system ATP-binding protein [Bosea sp. BE109]MDR7139581.1 peptide/nickel transport system ATP-binding protein [Bosea sp. BE168]MDR7176280.1 peptide/nickel transport system ATP-binding protein [Bosea sp. BE271]
MNASDPVMAVNRPAALTVSHLSVIFGRGAAALKAVDDVSFTLGHGEAFGLIGESGCGKSTVLRALAGLNSDYGGTIAFHDREVPHKRDKAFFRRVQMVFQDPYASLHPRKMVQNVLAEPLKIHGFDRPQERIDEILTAVGLGPSFRYRFPHELSGGQRQRVAIARALIIEPELLLLDEPTSALDVSVQAEILNLLKQLRRDRDLTYLMVSHDLAVVTHLCERVAMMSEGRILEEMSSADVRAGRAQEPYTREFLEASVGYRPIA